jgi:uncharacterized membrane protein YczE
VEQCIEIADHDGAGVGATRACKPRRREHPIEGGARRALTSAAPYVRLIGGLWLFAVGLAAMVRTNLGLSAWDVFHDALRTLTPFTFGQIVIGVSLVVLVASARLGVRPGVGTVANAVLVGAFTDAILSSPILQDFASASIGPRLVAMVSGIWGIALGSALYIGADLGAGPRDALMLGTAKHFGRSPGATRTVIEAVVLVTGMALGGSAGLGTVAFVALIGPSINVSFRLLGVAEGSQGDRARSGRAFGDRVRAWGQRGQLGAPESVEASRHVGARI